MKLDLQKIGLKPGIMMPAALFLICLLLFFSLGGYTSLWETDEARHAEVAREMVESGDWVTPRLNYVKYFEKPPLMYWAQAVSFSLFGVSEKTARLAPAFFAILSVMLVFWLGKSMWSTAAGFFAGLALCTSLLFFAVGRVLLVDMTLCFSVVLGLCGAWQTLQKAGIGPYLFWAGCALGLLSKGLLGPGLVMMPTVLFCLLAGELALLKRLVHWRGMLLFFLLAGPWVILASWKNPDFFGFFFIDEQFGRLLTSRHQRSEPFYFHLILLPATFFAWVVFLPWVLARLWPGKSWRKPASRAWLFACVWAGSFFLFFSASSSKMVHYILPMMPALALLTGRGLELAPVKSWLGESTEPGQRRALLALGLLVMLAGAGLVVFPAFSQDITYRDLGMALLLGPLAALGLGLGVISVRHRLWAVLAAPLGLFAAFLVLLLAAAPALEDYRSVKGILAEAASSLKPADDLVSYGDYYQGMPFYTGRRVKVVRNFGELDFGRKRDPQAAKWFIPTDRAFLDMMKNPKRRVVALAEDKTFDRLKKKARGEPGLLIIEWARKGDKVLFSNLPK